MKQRPRRRVAITGLGMVTPLGNDLPTSWERLLAGASGVAEISSFDASGFPTRIAAEVKDFDRDRLIPDRKLRRIADSFRGFALVAAEEALRDAGVRPSAETAERWGCMVGSGMMALGFSDLVDIQQRFAREGELDTERLYAETNTANPVMFCRSQVISGLWLLLRHFGIRGHTGAVHTACASGGQAVGAAMRLIRRGECDRVLTGGFDSMIDPVGLSSFCLLGALSTDNETPERASRPFDATRNGFVLGEGAGFLVLEEWESARDRGARIYAELAGDGNSLSSYRITDTHPSGDGPIQAMRQALADAAIDVDRVDYINAHGTSTPMNDRSECAAVRAVFGDHVPQLSVSSTKSLFGHLIAGAGAVETIVCALAIHEGRVPVNANLRQRDPECDLPFVTGKPLERPVRAAMSNSFGFGGSNSSVVLCSPGEAEASR